MITEEVQKKIWENVTKHNLTIRYEETEKFESFCIDLINDLIFKDNNFIKDLMVETDWDTKVEIYDREKDKFKLNSDDERD